MDKVYTKTGDKGMTALYTGQRLPKGSIRVETYGTIDEAQAVLAMARATAKHEDVRQDIEKIQTDLWQLMADTASIGRKANITDAHVEALERMIDRYADRLKPMTKFQVPGSNITEAYLNVARTVVRRAERSFWRLAENEEVHEVDIRYLNRLSDLCYTWGRVESEL